MHRQRSYYHLCDCFLYVRVRVYQVNKYILKQPGVESHEAFDKVKEEVKDYLEKNCRVSRRESSDKRGLDGR